MILSARDYDNQQIGLEEGIEKGIVKGRQEMLKLSNILIDLGRCDDLKKARNNPAVLSALLKEFGLDNGNE